MFTLFREIFYYAATAFTSPVVLTDNLVMVKIFLEKDPCEVLNTLRGGLELLFMKDL